jgi:hypothetical protein
LNRVAAVALVGTVYRARILRIMATRPVAVQWPLQCTDVPLALQVQAAQPGQGPVLRMIQARDMQRFLRALGVRGADASPVAVNRSFFEWAVDAFVQATQPCIGVPGALGLFAVVVGPEAREIRLTLPMAYKLMPRRCCSAVDDLLALLTLAELADVARWNGYPYPGLLPTKRTERGAAVARYLRRNLKPVSPSVHGQGDDRESK